MNTKIGILDELVEEKSLPPILLDSKLQNLSQDQQMTLALYKRLERDENEANAESTDSVQESSKEKPKLTDEELLERN